MTSVHTQKTLSDYHIGYCQFDFNPLKNKEVNGKPVITRERFATLRAVMFRVCSHYYHFSYLVKCNERTLNGFLFH